MRESKKLQEFLDLPGDLPENDGTGNFSARFFEQPDPEGRRWNQALALLLQAGISEEDNEGSAVRKGQH